jgi:hypothetical protein
MASRTGISRGEGDDGSDSSSGIEQGDEPPPHVNRPPSQCSDSSNASTGSGDTEGPEESFSSDHAQVMTDLVHAPPTYCIFVGRSLLCEVQLQSLGAVL